MKRFAGLTAILSVLLLLILGTAYPEKKKEDEEPVVHYKMDVKLRLIDVVVLDSDGNHVADLTADDFLIYEEGEKQKIVTFDNLMYKIKRKAEAEKETEKKPEAEEEKEKVEEKVKETPEKRKTRIGEMIEAPREALGRSIVLLFDNYNTHHSHLVKAKKAAKEFVSEDLLPEDRVSVMKYYGSAKVLQDFTGDKIKLFEAIDSLSVSLGDPLGVAEIADEKASSRLSRNSYVQGNAMQFTDMTNPYRTDGTWDYSEKYYNVMNFMDVLKTIGWALKDIKGRKTIIFMSPGFLGVNPVTTPWMYVNMGRVLERMSGYNVTLYSVDVSGVATDPRGKREERWDFLTFVADKTGGKLFRNNNNLRTQLQRVNYEISHFYLLGYKSDNVYNDGRFIEVKVECKRPDTKVRTVKGLYASRSWDMMTVEERTSNLHRILDQGTLFTQLPIRVDRTSSIPSHKYGVVYPLIIRFPVFSKFKKYEYLSYDLYLRIKDPVSNTIIDKYFQEIRIEKESLVGDEFIVSFPLDLLPGEHLVELVVKNNITSDTGTKYFKISSPQEIKGFAATNPRIFTSYQDATILFPESEGLVKADAYYPHVPKHVIPLIGNKLYVNEETIIYFALKNFSMDLKKEEADVELNFVLNKHGKVVKTPLDVGKFIDGKNDKILNILVRIPPNTLEVGRYYLRIYCRDRTTGDIMTNRIPLNYTTRREIRASR